MSLESRAGVKQRRGRGPSPRGWSFDKEHQSIKPEGQVAIEKTLQLLNVGSVIFDQLGT
jgi:hypothetical protein